MGFAGLNAPILDYLEMKWLRLYTLVRLFSTTSLLNKYPWDWGDKQYLLEYGERVQVPMLELVLVATATATAGADSPCSRNSSSHSAKGKFPLNHISLGGVKKEKHLCAACAPQALTIAPVL